MKKRVLYVLIAVMALVSAPVPVIAQQSADQQCHQLATEVTNAMKTDATNELYTCLGNAGGAFFMTATCYGLYSSAWLAAEAVGASVYAACMITP